MWGMVLCVADCEKPTASTLIPLAVYFSSSGKAKVELALARGKTHGDRRQDSRAREDRREIARAERRG